MPAQANPRKNQCVERFIQLSRATSEAVDDLEPTDADDRTADDGTIPPAPGAANTAHDLVAKQVAAALASMMPAIQAAADAHAAEKPAILQAVARVQERLRANRLDEAKSLLTQFAATVKGLRDRPESEAGGGADGYSRANQLWKGALSKARSDVDRLCRLIQVDYPEVEADQLGHVLGSFDGELDSALSGLAGAADAGQRESFRRRALEALQRYQAELGGNPLLAHLDDNPWQKMKIRQLLSAALAEVGKQLQA